MLHRCGMMPRMCVATWTAAWCCPVAGDWKGVTYHRGEATIGSPEFKNAVVRYPTVGLQFTDVSPVVEVATISDTAGLGIACEGNASLTLTGITMRTGTRGHQLPLVKGS